MKPYYTGLQRISGPLMSKWAIWLFKGAELQWEVFPKFMTVEPQKHAQSLEEIASYRIYSGKAPTIYISKVADPCNPFSFSVGENTEHSIGLWKMPNGYLVLDRLPVGHQNQMYNYQTRLIT